MLVEALAYALSLAATPARFRPHLADAVGLWARGRRQRAGWQPHLQLTRGHLSETVNKIERRRTVVVLGSGPLFDVPIEALAQAFERVVLVDRIHLFSARRRIARFANVELAWHDLSTAAGAEPLMFLDDIADLDWVISLNLLSQLGFGAPDGREREVIESHLDGLSALCCRVSLVTDLDYATIDRSGRASAAFDLLYGRAMPEAAARWPWHVAPFGEEARNSRRTHTVAFYPDWR